MIISSPAVSSHGRGRVFKGNERARENAHGTTAARACYMARVQAPWRSRLAWLGGVALVGLAIWFARDRLLPATAPASCDALARERIIRVFAVENAGLRCAGVRVESLDAPLREALAGRDGAALAALLRARKGSAIAVLPEPSSVESVAGSLRSLAYVASLRGVVLGPSLAVYAASHEPQLSDEESGALAYVARALLRGSHEPNVASFPAALRRVERVEVMVMLSHHGEPRLWRSARGTSIARALLTASRVARDRWREREVALGGPLAKRLLELDVEVSLLFEDGNLSSAQAGFVDRAVTSAHGLGFDHRTAWHYALPRDVAAAKRGPFDVLTKLILEQGLTLSILGDTDTRLYRFVQLALGMSKAPLPDEATRAPRP